MKWLLENVVLSIVAVVLVLGWAALVVPYVAAKSFWRLVREITES